MESVQIAQTVQTVQTAQTYPTNIKNAKHHDYKYWKTKPMQKIGDISYVSQNIEQNLKNRKVYSGLEQLKLPESMKWINIDINNVRDKNMLDKVSLFLRTNYLTDETTNNTTGETTNDTDKFSLNYTSDFLKWSIGVDNICLAIVTKKSETICGFISASFRKITVFETTKKFAVVDFLCSHPVYKTKGIAQILIDEMIRQIVNEKDIHQGCFCTDRWIPSPVSTIRMYNRPINYIKLQKYEYIDLEFMKPILKRNPEKIQKLFDLVGPIDENIIPMTEDHLTQVYKLYNIFMSRCNICINYTIDELKYYLLFNNTDIVKSYVYIGSDGAVIDFFSYYKLNTIIKNERESINAGYLFLYSCNMSNGKFIQNIIKTIKNDNIDVFNVLDTLIIPDTIFSKKVDLCDESDDESFTESYQYGFLKSSVKKHLNFFNWKCPTVKSDLIFWPQI